MTFLKRTHIQHKVSDFVLDLLPTEEREAVSRHIAGCSDCRRAVQNERQIGRLVHSTLNTVTRPDAHYLRQLRPAMPARRRSLLTALTPYRQWAVACLFIVAMMGAFIFGSERGYNGIVRQAGTHSATLSSLNAPGTTAPQTTRPADALFTTAVLDEAGVSDNYPVDFNNPPTAPEPIAPQVTPAPAATYYQ